MTIISNMCLLEKTLTVIHFSIRRLNWTLQLSMKIRMCILFLAIALRIPISQAAKIAVVNQVFIFYLYRIRNDLFLTKYLFICSPYSKTMELIYIIMICCQINNYKLLTLLDKIGFHCL